MITLKRGLSQLSMSCQNISLPIFLHNLCPIINTCAYTIKLWGGHQLHLLTMRECEDMWGHHLNVSQLPFPPYCLEQYCTSYSTFNHFHLSFVCLNERDFLFPRSIIYLSTICAVQTPNLVTLWTSISRVLLILSNQTQRK